ncbi:TadE/TadG family type IV pilus assembly protein [Castellaniella hirudinis]|uniref:TadE/TadG family type IV pilus assembly protein n=1 Tax=Castellaniella hirudinis TaxID=1144617 RepID=UPI0039C1618D
MTRKNPQYASDLHALHSDQQGAVAVSFVIFFMLALAVFLFATDLARYNVVSTRLWNSVDASLLSAASKYHDFKTEPNPDSLLNNDANHFFLSNLPDKYLDSSITGTPDTAIIDDEKILSMRAEGKLNLFSGHLLPNNFFSLHAYNEVTLPASGPSGFDEESFSVVPPLGYDYNFPPIPSKDKSVDLYLNAFYDKWDAMRDVFYDGGITAWHFGSAIPGKELTSSQYLPIWTQADRQLMPRLNRDLNSISVLDLSDPSWYGDKVINQGTSTSVYGESLHGERLVMTFIESGTSNFSKDISELSIPLVCSGSCPKIRAAVFYGNDQITSEPQIFTSKQNGDTINIKATAGKGTISRVVIGTEDDVGAFAIGTNIQTGEGSGEEGDLRLSK